MKKSKRRTPRAHSATPITVTTENFGDLLIEGTREAVAVARGELAPARMELLPGERARQIS